MFQFLSRFFVRERAFEPLTDEQKKSLLKITFIDDKTIEIHETLKVNGWTNVNKILDPRSLTQDSIKSAHVIFVDIDGIGRKLNFPNQGLGLAQEIKRQYPTKKVVSYSRINEGDRLDPSLNYIDAIIRKNASVAEYIKLLEQYLDCFFTIEGAAKHISETLSKIYKSPISEDKVIKNLRRANQYHQDKVWIQKNFGISEVAAIADIGSFLATVAQFFK